MGALVSGALGFVRGQWVWLLVAGAILAGAAVVNKVVASVEAGARYEAAADRLALDNADLAAALTAKQAELEHALETVASVERQKRAIAADAAALRRFIDTTKEGDNAPAAPVLTGTLDRLAAGGESGPAGAPAGSGGLRDD